MDYHLGTFRIVTLCIPLTEERMETYIHRSELGILSVIHLSSIRNPLSLTVVNVLRAMPKFCHQVLKPQNFQEIYLTILSVLVSLWHISGRLWLFLIKPPSWMVDSLAILFDSYAKKIFRLTPVSHISDEMSIKRIVPIRMVIVYQKKILLPRGDRRIRIAIQIVRTDFDLPFRKVSWVLFRSWLFQPISLSKS